MNSIIVGVSLLVFLAGASLRIYENRFGNLSWKSGAVIDNSSKDVLGESNEENGFSVDTDEFIEDKKDLKNTDIPKPTQTVVSGTTDTLPSKTPSPTQIINVETGIEQYIYPGSDVLAKGDSSLSLRSSDNYNKVTDWYENLVKEKDFNAKSINRNKANNVVLNRIVAAKSGLKVDIKITFENAKTEISVQLTK